MVEVGMKNNYIFHSFHSSDALVASLTSRIINDLQLAIETKGEAFLAVSGGSTPKKLFLALSQSDLAWNKVTITLVDERWVKPSHIHSNEKLVRQYLIQNKASEALCIGLKNNFEKATQGLHTTSEALKKISSFDVVILGMGEDGHTASFFPHTYNLKELLTTTELCSATEATTKPKERITLNKKFLLTASSLLLHIEGEKKKTVFERASQSDDIENMPIVSMMQQTKPILEVYYA